MQTLQRKEPRFQQTRKVHHYRKAYKKHQIKRHLRQKLIERPNFWIQTLETLHPKGLNRELST